MSTSLRRSPASSRSSSRCLRPIASPTHSCATARSRRAADTLAAYDAFLALVDDGEVRAELRAIDSRQAAEASASFRTIAGLGATIDEGLLKLLFGTDLAPVSQRYAVF